MKLSIAVFVLLVLTVSLFAANYCSSLEKYKEKREFYKELATSQEKMVAAKLNLTTAQVDALISTIDKAMASLEKLCEKEKAAAQTTTANAQTAATEQAANTEGAAGVHPTSAMEILEVQKENGTTAVVRARIKKTPSCPQSMPPKEGCKYGTVVLTDSYGCKTHMCAPEPPVVANISGSVAHANASQANIRAQVVSPATPLQAQVVTPTTTVSASAAASGSSATTGALARFAYWWGKVTMVQSASGGWVPAANKKDGANINPLTYCKQLDSRALGVREVGKESMSGWINREGKADSAGRTSYSEAGVVYECLPYYAFDVRTRLNPNVPLFSAPEGAASAQTDNAAEAMQTSTGTAVRKTESAASAAKAGVTSDEIVAPLGTSAAGDVSDYYRQKMQGILQKSDSVDAQIASLKQLSSEINSLIASLLEKKSRIALNEEGMKEIVKAVRVTPAKVSAGEVEVDSKGKIIEAKVAAVKPIEVEAKGSEVVLRDNGVEAQAAEVTVTAEAVSVGGADVKVTPSEAAKKVSGAKKKLTITTSANKKAVYNVDAQSKAKILGILPVEMPRKVSVDAQSGSIISDEKPIWSVIAVEDKAANEAAEAASAAAVTQAASAKVAAEETAQSASSGTKSASAEAS